jgi:hypothetical protein
VLHCTSIQWHFACSSEDSGKESPWLGGGSREKKEGKKREEDAGKWKGVDAEAVGAQEKSRRGRSGAVLGARERGGG